MVETILLWSARTAVTVLVISLCLAIICAFCESCILGLEIQRYFSNRPEMLLFSYTHIISGQRSACAQFQLFNSSPRV